MRDFDFDEQIRRDETDDLLGLDNGRLPEAERLALIEAERIEDERLAAEAEERWEELKALDWADNPRLTRPRRVN